jgi:hypothetical protein
MNITLFFALEAFLRGEKLKFPALWELMVNGLLIHRPGTYQLAAGAKAKWREFRVAPGLITTLQATLLEALYWSVTAEDLEQKLDQTDFIKVGDHKLLDESKARKSWGNEHPEAYSTFA